MLPSGEDCSVPGCSHRALPSAWVQEKLSPAFGGGGGIIMLDPQMRALCNHHWLAMLAHKTIDLLGPAFQVIAYRLCFVTLDPTTENFSAEAFGSFHGAVRQNPQHTAFVASALRAALDAPMEEEELDGPKATPAV